MDYRFLALAIMILWGVQNIFVKLVLERMSSTFYYFLSSVATFVGGVVAYLILRPKVDVSLPILVLAFILALSVTFTYLLFLYTLNKGPANVVIPIVSLNVAVTAVLATIFLGEPLTLKKGLGILFATIAVVLLSL